MKRLWKFLTRYSIGANNSVRPLPIEYDDFNSFGFTVEIPKEEWAPGLWAGTEGLKLTIMNVDLENRKLTLAYK